MNSMPWSTFQPGSTFNPMSAMQPGANWLESFMVQGDYAWFWNYYISALMQMQEAVQNFSQNLLHWYGIPTREEIEKLNVQFYDLQNRLDELENRLNAQPK